MNASRAKQPLTAPLVLSHYPHGIGDVDVADPSKPLEVLVGPIDLSQRDRIDLYWGARPEPVASYTHSPDAPDTNGIFSLYVDTRWIEPGVTTVRYTYTPYPSATPELSPTREVTVKLSIPGGRDPDPESPYENERLTAPDVAPPGVITTPDGVSVTVRPWDNMSVGDQLSIYWHGLLIRSEPLLAGQIGHPVVVAIPREVVIEAGDSDMIVVRYDIRDVVHNWSRFSPPTYVEVEAGNATLPAPIAPQAPQMELDLDKLAGADVQALVLTHPQIAIGDTLQFIVERNNADGLPLQPYVLEQVIQAPASFFEFLIPNAQFQPIAQGRARFRYRVNKASGESLRSKSLSLSILGQARELALPRVPAAVDGVLDPTLHNLIAQVPAYSFMADGQDVTLVWMGRTGDGMTLLHQETKNLNQDDVGQALEFLIPDDKLAPLAGGAVELYYTITTFERDFFKSPTLHLTVDVDASRPLPAPQVDQVDAQGVLDPDDLVLEAVVRIQPYPAMAIGDRVTLHWQGDRPGGTYGTYTVLNSGTVNKTVIFRVPKNFVTANLDAGVDVWYEVLRGGRTFVSLHTHISIRQDVAAPLPRPTVKEAEGDRLDPANAGQGATVQIAASADLRSADRVTVTWQGPKGSDQKEKTLTEADVGKVLEMLFAAALVNANVGEQVAISYRVERANGQVQTSETLLLAILENLGTLPAPSMDEVGPDGVVLVSRIPASGATVRVRYPGMSSGDRVQVRWRGATAHDTAEQIAGGHPELVFNLPKAVVVASEGRSAALDYRVTRGGNAVASLPLPLTIRSELSLDTRPVTLAGKVYLIPGHPDLLPTFPAGTTIKRVPTGGQPPYRYSSSQPTVAKVDTHGLVSVRGKGRTHITVSDSLGQSLSYEVTVTGVIHCMGVGSGSYKNLSAAAASRGGRMPNLQELRELHAAYGSRWPMGNGMYWSSDIQMVIGWNWYYTKNLVSGAEDKLKESHGALGVALR
ncbi:hypothetical protein [uncultured Pseudomonas sp.]|uniref:hypothetical protein n=1 Tax=uncultured Pseudomonas sp. TaxID=114707 RepID=UPI0025EEEB4B|nr:hypothetical protein [uncultured Pseudomonas sp.]